MPDLRSAVEKLDNREFKGSTVRCAADVDFQPSPAALSKFANTEQPQEERPRERYRSRSPQRGGRGYPPGPPGDYYERRGPRDYSPRREDNYRRRTPPREYYERDRGYGRPSSRGPPRGGDYNGPPPRRYDDPYGPPPARGGGPPYEEPYTNGHGAHSRPYAGPTSPRPRYEERPRYW
jgi:transcription initiation factor TFIID subunit 15